MTTSTPPAWHFLQERYVPVSTPPSTTAYREYCQMREEALSEDSRILADSATLGAQNDNPDPTYQDCWPSDRYPSDGDQCPECRCAPGQPHAPGCEGV